jgi:uncharacterized protein involved in response to NO
MQIAPPSRKQPINGFALFQLGFRPFFLGGTVFAVVSITWWLLSLLQFTPTPLLNTSASQWHAHEMLYGYGMAIIAGFLLTAVKNWTNLPTPTKLPLALLFGSWLLARILNLLPGHDFTTLAMGFDIGFSLWLIVAVATPIIKAKQWPQLAVVTKLTLLCIGNLLFYLGTLEILASGVTISQWIAIVLMLSLILMIGRRVIPFFIERGVGYPVKLKQSKWVDISIMFAFIAWLISLLTTQPILGSISCALIFALNSYRLAYWHTSGIWKAPLLWSLYSAMWLMNIGFLLTALQAMIAYPYTWSLHVFTIGGIGLMTLAMMARVSLGHTGRDIRNPPKVVSWIFSLMLAAVIFRVLLPMWMPDFYRSWLVMSGIIWCIAFTLFVITYASILIKPRADGLEG